MERTKLPVIACTLTSDQRVERQREMEELARRSVVGREQQGRLVRLHYRHTPQVEAAVRDLVRRESQCCAFLAFDIAVEGARLTLEIRGPEGSEEVLGAIYTAAGLGG